MKIAMLLERFSRQEANTYAHMVDLCETLAEKGVEIHVITKSRCVACARKNLFQHILPSGLRVGTDIPLFITKTLGVVKRYDIDLIYGHILSKLLFVSATIKKITHIPLVFWHCGLDELERKFLRGENVYHLLGLRAGLRMLVNYNYIFLPSIRWVDKLVTGTNSMKETYIHLLNIPRNKIVVIPSFVDTKRFSPDILTKSAYEELRSKLGLDAEDFVVVYVGRLSEQKGLGILLKACAKAINKYPKIKLLIVGGDPFNASKDKGRIFFYKNLTYSFIMSKNVIFTGSVPNSVLPHYLAVSNLFVLPSLVEGFPRAIIEAMSCAKPVIASDSPELSEIVIHGKTGILVKPGNIDELSRAIERLYIHRDLVASMGANGRLIAEKKYDIKVVANEWIDIFKKTIEGYSDQ